MSSYRLNLDEIKALSKAALKEWVLDCEQRQHDALLNAADEILRSEFTLVALAGPSCSGKSTTAHRLISYFSAAGKDVKVISTDDYFHNIADYPKTNNGAPDFDHFDCMKKSLLSEVLRGICDGEEVSLSRFDFITGRRTDHVETYRPMKNSIVILEGIHALNPLLYHKGMHYYKLALNVTEPFYANGSKLFTPREVRLIRRIIRDEKKRNYRAEQTMNIWGNVVNGEQNFILPFFEDVDAYISTGLAYEPCVWKNDALDSLRAIPKEDKHRPLADDLIARLEPIPKIDTELVPTDSILQEFLGKNEH